MRKVKNRKGNYIVLSILTMLIAAFALHVSNVYATTKYSTTEGSVTFYEDTCHCNVTRKWKARLDYTTSTTNTSLKVTVSAAGAYLSQSNAWASNFSGTLSATNYSTLTKAKARYDVENGRFWKMFTNKTFSYSRGSSAVTKTISVTPKHVAGSDTVTQSPSTGALTASVSIKVPELNKVTIYYKANGGTIPDSPHKYTVSTTGTVYYFKLSSGTVRRSGTKTGTYSSAFHSVHYGSSTKINLWNVGTMGIKRTGYHIDSATAWNTKADGKGTSYSQLTDYSYSTFGSASSTTTKTLYAKWVPNTYKVVYNANGGSGTMDEQQNLKYGTTYTASTNAFTRSGYVFVGWSSNAAGTKPIKDNKFTSLTSVNGDTATLYAMWDQKPTHTLTAYANGSGCTIPAQDGWTGSGNSATKTLIEDYRYGAFPDAECSGCHVSGWFNAATGGTEVTPYTMVTSTSPTSVYARWVANTLIFNDQTLNVSYSSSSQTKNVTAVENGSGTYSYAKVSGDSGISVSSSGVITIPAGKAVGSYNITIQATDTNSCESNVTQTAIYTINVKSTYTVVFNSNGGTGTMSNQSFMYDEEKILNENQFTKSNYKFIGWNTTASSDTGNWYMQDVPVKNITSQNGATVILYARWAPLNDAELSVDGEPLEQDSGGNDVFENHPHPTIDVIAVNGLVGSGTSASQTIEYGTSTTFNLTTSIDPYVESVSCTNEQEATFSNGVLTVSDVLADTTCTVEFFPSSQDFAYTGDVQSYTVPKDGYYYIELGGAAGYRPLKSRGAITSGYIALEQGEILYFYIGQKGEQANRNCGTSAYKFNGGAPAVAAANGNCGPSGGGASDVRLESGFWYDEASLISRIMVAGGGAGSTANFSASPGYGGTLYGGKAIYVGNSGSSITNANQGKAGTQKSGGEAPTKIDVATSNGAPGEFGMGGYGGAGPADAEYGGSGGGGGYYGGSGSSGSTTASVLNGGGGSSYISGYAGVNSVEETTELTHTYQTLHYSGKYFLGGEMIRNQNGGNGYGTIRYVGNEPARINTNLNGVRYIKDCITANTKNAANHWVEIQAIKDGENVAKDKDVTGTHAENSSYPYSRITDGDIATELYARPATNVEDAQCVTVDLDELYDLDEVAVWNYFGDHRRYTVHTVSVSSDNTNWTEISRALGSREIWRETANGARWNAYRDHINGYLTGGSMPLWLDGFANTGELKNRTTTIWKNLSYDSTSTYNGTIMNGTTAGATWKYNYLVLDGTNDWVKLWKMNYTKPTIEVVISPTKDYTEEGDVVANFESGGYGMYMTTGNSVGGSWYINGGFRSLRLASTFVATNEMGYFATTYDETTRRVFQDGVQTTSSTAYTGALGATTNNTVMAIGTNPNGTAAQNKYFQGKIYSVRIHNVALTAEQLYRNYLFDKQEFVYDPEEWSPDD